MKDSKVNSGLKPIGLHGTSMCYISCVVTSENFENLKDSGLLMSPPEK